MSISRAASSPAVSVPAELESLQLALSSCSTTNSRYIRNVPITTDLTPPTLPQRHSHTHHTVTLTPSVPQPTPTRRASDLSARSPSTHTVRPIMIHAVEVSCIAGYSRHTPIHRTFTAIWRRTDPRAYTALSRSVVSSVREEDEMADVLVRTSIPQRIRELRATIADITPTGIRAVYGELEERVEKEVKLQSKQKEELAQDDEEERQPERLKPTSAAEPAPGEDNLRAETKADSTRQVVSERAAPGGCAEGEHSGRRDADEGPGSAVGRAPDEHIVTDDKPVEPRRPHSNKKDATTERSLSTTHGLSSVTCSVLYGVLEERVEKEVKLQSKVEEEPVRDDEEERQPERLKPTSAAEPAPGEDNLRAETKADSTEQVTDDKPVEPRRPHSNGKDAITERRLSTTYHSERRQHAEVREKLKDLVRREVRKMYGVEKEKAVIKAMKANGQIVRRNNKELHKKIMGTTTHAPHTLTLTRTHWRPDLPGVPAESSPSTGVASPVPRVWMLGGRVDGFVNGELIEIKNRTTHLPRTLPLQDKCQFLVYLHILGLDSGRLVELIRGGGRYEQRKETVVVREDEDRLWSVCRWHLQRLVDFLSVFMSDEARQRAYVAASEAEQEAMLREVWPIGYQPRHRSMQRVTLHQPVRRAVRQPRPTSIKRLVLTERVSGGGKSRKKLSKSAKVNLGKPKARKLSSSKKVATPAVAAAALSQQAAPTVLEQSV